MHPQHVLINLTFLAICVAQLPISTLFQVDFSGTADGGCLNPGETALNNQAVDSLTLANAGVALLQATSSSNEAANRLVDAFFRSPSIGSRKQIQRNFQTVADFISKNTLTSAVTGGKPWLFCGSNWVTRVVNGNTLTKNSIAWDKNGPGNEVKDNNGNPMTIFDVYQPFWTSLQLAFGKKQVIPYWSSRYNSYILDQTYGGINNGYCSAADSVGVTQSQTQPPSVTLCNRAYAAGTRVTIPANVNTVPIANIQAGTPGSASTLGEFIDSANPVTLYHELFHLLLGTGNTPDAAYPVTDMLLLTTDEAVANPETYVATSYAWLLTTQLAQVNGQPVEFFSGFATAG